MLLLSVGPIDSGPSGDGIQSMPELAAVAFRGSADIGSGSGPVGAAAYDPVAVIVGLFYCAAQLSCLHARVWSLA
jgi:hypothetical protein